MQHVARGADAVMFFQWRQSKAGAEKFHSAMFPHAGEDSDVWRSTVELGQALTRIGEVRGSRVRSRAALVVDYPAWWASELDSHPTQVLRYMDEVRAWHAALWEQGITVDTVTPRADLDGYDLVVVPTLYLVDDAGAANLAAAAERGATVAITFFSGIVDESDQVRLGGYPGAFRDLLGVLTQEFATLQEGETVRVVGKAVDGEAHADLWTEKTHVADGTEVVATYDDGALAGWPAVTRRDVGAGGSAWYVGTRLERAGLGALVAQLVETAGVKPEVVAPVGVEVTRRVSDDGSWLFAINHTDDDASLDGVTGSELLTGTDVAGTLTVPAGAVRVVRLTA
jgi:beta-galactosidase